MKKLDRLLCQVEEFKQAFEDWPGALILTPEEAEQYTGRCVVIIDDL